MEFNETEFCRFGIKAPPPSKKNIITNETKKKQDYTAVTVVTSDLSSGMSNSKPLYQNYNM